MAAEETEQIIEGEEVKVLIATRAVLIFRFRLSIKCFCKCGGGAPLEVHSGTEESTSSFTFIQLINNGGL